MYSRLFFVLAAALVLAAGCGGGETRSADEPREVETPATGEAPAPDGFQRYAVDSAGVSVAVPDDWETVGIDEIHDDALDELGRENPDFAPVFDALKDPETGIVLVADDPDVSDGFATNLTIRIVDAPRRLIVEKYAETTGIKGSGLTVGRVRESLITLPGGKGRPLRLQHQVQGARKEAAVRPAPVRVRRAWEAPLADLHDARGARGRLRDGLRPRGRVVPHRP